VRLAPLVSAGLACGLALLAPAVASAKTMVGLPASSFGDKSPVRYESSQWFALEIKFSPYTPHIDQSPGLDGATPFADLFNKQDDVDKRGQQPAYRLLTTVEFDVQFLHRAWGNLGFGITTGFYRRTTHGFQRAPNPDTGAFDVTCQVPSCVRSGDIVSLNIIPLSLLFVYRFDLLANRYRIPLVPYVKIGLAYYIWFMGDGNNAIAKSPEKAHGGTFGWVAHPGLALQLDFIERGVAKTLDTELGINHTYLFCELNYADIRGFGAQNKLNLSDLMLNAGLAFEF
jgi:hypothetical protein